MASGIIGTTLHDPTRELDTWVSGILFKRQPNDTWVAYIHVPTAHPQSFWRVFPKFNKKGNFSSVTKSYFLRNPKSRSIIYSYMKLFEKGIIADCIEFEGFKPSLKSLTYFRKANYSIINPNTNYRSLLFNDNSNEDRSLFYDNGIIHIYSLLFMDEIDDQSIKICDFDYDKRRRYFKSLYLLEVSDKELGNLNSLKIIRNLGLKK